VLVLVGATALAGCGESDHFANRPPPPEPITITAAIDHNRIRVSPPSFGAGGVTVLISNQSGAAQTLTFETNEVGGSQGGIRKSVGPVADGGTAELQVDPRQGTYQLSTKDHAIRPAAIHVGKRRPANRDNLLSP
jgi:hypothetical protein